MLEAISAGREITGRAGSFRCRPMTPWAAPGGRDATAIDVQRLSGEQSNTSISLGRELILKSLRRPRPGVNPEVEITQFLTARGFPHVPRLVGWMDHAAADGETATVSVLQGFVDNDGDGWRHVLRALGRAVDSLARPSDARDTCCASLDDPLIQDMTELGRVTGELHAALASDPVDPAFAPEPVTAEDARRWESGIAAALDRASSNADSRLTPSWRARCATSPPAATAPSRSAPASISSPPPARTRSAAMATTTWGRSSRPATASSSSTSRASRAAPSRSAEPSSPRSATWRGCSAH